MTVQKCCKFPDDIRIVDYADGDIPLSSCASCITLGGYSNWNGELHKYGEGFNCSYFPTQRTMIIDGKMIGPRILIKLWRSHIISDPHVPGQKWENNGIWIFQIKCLDAFVGPPTCTFGTPIIAYRAVSPGHSPVDEQYIWVQGCAGTVSLNWEAFEP